MTYTVEINMIGNKIPLTLKLESKGYKRKIGFYEIRELETVEEFVSRKLTTFLETIKNYPESKHSINI